MPGGGLVGRRLAVGALCAEIDRAVAGAGGVLLLVGDAGMGKTALASEAVAYARAHGATTLWGACGEGDGAPGYWPWIQVMRGLGGDDVPVELTGSVPMDGGVLGDDAARFRTYDAVARHLRAHAKRSPLVIVLDDLHWADVSSVRLLLFLARQLHDVGIVVIGTYRDVEVASAGHPARALLAELAGQAELIHLTGLSTDEVGLLMHKACGERPSAGLARIVHERTAGNPFFVQQVARLLISQGAELERAAVGGVPPGVGEVLRRRLARVPTKVVDLAGVAAVIGHQVSLATLAVVAGSSVDATLRAVDIAVRAGIVEPDGPGQVRFTHALFREVLYDGLPLTKRSELHLAVAELLQQQGDPGTTAAVAHHRTAALPVGDRPRAVAALVEAAREATGRTAYDEAASQLRRAVEVAGGNMLVDTRTLCAYGDALRRAGAATAAREAFRIAAARARSAGDLVILGRAAFGAHRVPTLTETSRADVIALLKEALTAVDGPDRWLLTASLARELSDGPDVDRDRALALANEAVEGARAAGDDAALAYALFALCDARWEPGTGRERMRIADDLAAAAGAAGETELLLEARLSTLVAMLELGDPAFAEEVDTFARLGEQSGIPHYRYMARSRQATRASLTGPFALADELIESAAAYGDEIGEPDSWGVQSSQLIGLAFLRHDWSSASALAAVRGLSLAPAEFAYQERAWLLVEAGDLEAAADVVASTPDRRPLYRWRHAALLTTEAELAVVVHDRARCAALYDQLLPLAAEFAVVGGAVFTTGPVALQLGLLADQLGRPDDAVAHLEDAVVRCERMGATLLAARARTELSRVSRPKTNLFRRDGDVWTLVYAGRNVQLRDAKGLRDLAVLLAAPGKEVPATELVGLPDIGADPILDSQALTAYRSRLAALDEELHDADARADAERSGQLTAERDALIHELSRATGLGGRRRRLGDTGERARSTVTARIRDTIGRIERVHPELGRHLRAGIGTGARCVYRPAETVRWTVSQS